MVKKTLQYIWGKKFLLILLVLVIFLLPNVISRDLQVRTVPIITSMEITVSGENISIEAEKLKASPGEKVIQYDKENYTGTDIKQMLKKTSLAHCTAIKFTGEPNIEVLSQLYDYKELRSNTKINEDKTIDELLKSHHYCYQ